MKKVAIVGKPNVGKSSLFNRLAKKRDAITSDVSGTTRDIKKNIITLLEDREFELLDTGGIDYTSELFSKVGDMALDAAKKADIILYMVDGKTIPDDEDKELFWALQSEGKPIALLVNKIDNDKELQEKFWEFSEFGAENIFGISVSHNRGLSPFYKWLEGQIPPMEQSQTLIEDDDIPLEFLFAEDEEAKEEEKEFKVAIIGRVNTGKSSLLNALLKEDRVIVSDVAGTTIDPIDESIIYDDYKITFVDTAGIRRRSKIVGIEKYALNRTENMLKDADIAILLIDATVGVTELDERVAGLIDKYKLGSLIVLNKWDIKGDEVDYKKAVEDIRDELKFLHYAPLITISAKTGLRVHKILDMLINIFKNYSKRMPTSKLNDAIKMAISRHHVPSYHGQVVKIKFATQFATKHPRIALIVNKPNLLHFSYQRYLTNFLRDQFDFEGTPIELVVKKNVDRRDQE